MLKAVLFDLDGTLLPMHESEFIKKYGELLFVKMSKLGLDGQKLGKLVKKSYLCGWIKPIRYINEKN